MSKILKTVALVAAGVALVATGVGALAGAGIAFTSLSAAGLSLIAGVATIATVVALGASLLGGLLAPKPGPGLTTPTAFRQTITESQIVYGTARVGPLITFYHANVQGGTDYRYYVGTLAGHACAGVTGWQLNDEIVDVDPSSGLVTTGKYANCAWLWAELGATPAVANATFVAETDGAWTANHRGDGIAKLYAKFKLTDQVIAEGYPNITAVVAGKTDIYDPRTGARGFTDNAILCTYDWMLTPRPDGGFGIVDDEVDWDFVSTQANICDEAVALKAGGSEPRYTCDGVITTGAEPASIRDTLLTSFAGDYTYSGGLHLFYAGAWRPPATTLAEADLVQPISLAPLASADQIANHVLGTFNDPAQKYQPQEYPDRSVAAVGDDDLQLNLDLPFTKSNTMCQRISKIVVLRTAAERSVTWAMNIRGIAVQALDVVQAATARFGISNYSWKVAGWGIANFNVTLALREESPEFYDWTPAVDEQTPVVSAPSIAVPVAYNVGSGGAPAGLTITIDSPTQLTVSFTLPPTAIVSGYDVVFQTSGSYSGVAARSGTAVAGDVVSETFTGLTTGTTYYAWARARLSTGATSPVAGPVSAAPH